MTRTDSIPAALGQDAAVDALARRLDAAWEGRTTIEPPSRADGLSSPRLAYAVQTRWSQLRQERGDRVVGHKIGLTSRPMQEQMNVGEPDYGRIWSSRVFAARRGWAEVPSGVFVQPLAEGELAFLIGAPLEGPSITPLQVLAATDALAVAIEIIDSRITDWRIGLVDTIADNASYGAMVLGPWDRSLRHHDLRTLGMVIHHNGNRVVEGVGAAALGHPARSVAWLANTLSELGVSLGPGDVVLSGSIGRSMPVRQGDVFQVEAAGQPPLGISLT